MGDMTIHAVYTCVSNQDWSIEVASSRVGGKSYTVTYGRTHDPKAQYEFDYDCTCEAQKFGKRNPCKHIKEYAEVRCGWNQAMEMLEPAKDMNGKPICPDCGREVVAVSVAC